MKWSNDAHELGASKVPIAVLGKDRFGTSRNDLKQIVHQARAGVTHVDNRYADASERGNELEKPLAEWAVKRIRKYCTSPQDAVLVYPKEGYRIEDEKICASLDAMVFIQGGNVKIWCPFGEFILPEGEYIPLEIKTDGYTEGPPTEEHVIQLQTQMMCTGTSIGIIAKLGPKLNFDLWVYERDDDLCAVILQKVREFWYNVEHDIDFDETEQKPAVVDLNGNDEAERLQAMVDGYLKAKVKQEDAKVEKEQYQELIEKFLHRNNVQIGSLGNHRLEYKKVLRKSKPEQITPATPATEYYRFSVKEL